MPVSVSSVVVVVMPVSLDSDFGEINSLESVCENYSLSYFHPLFFIYRGKQILLPPNMSSVRNYSFVFVFC